MGGGRAAPGPPLEWSGFLGTQGGQALPATPHQLCMLQYRRGRWERVRQHRELAALAAMALLLLVLLVLLCGMASPPLFQCGH